MTRVWAHKLKIAASMAVAIGIAMPAAFATPAYAADRDELARNYQTAIVNYESLVGEQSRNADEIVAVDAQIARTQASIDENRDYLNKAAVSQYKGFRGNVALADFVLGSSSFQEAMIRYDTFERIERYYDERIDEYVEIKSGLDKHMGTLVQRKAELEQQVEDAIRATQEAEQALADNYHRDGADYHQTQGNGSNCGATSFIVGLNVLLHENRYTDNVAVWEGPGFDGDSTNNIAYRGGVWLVANGLSDFITVEALAGDIHTAAEMREQLEQGRVVIVSSGSGSTWVRADGTEEEGLFPDGHWIVFYRYEDGIYYANDSSESAEKGAGCPYTEEQMQAWLDGRSNHFATVMYKWQ